MSRFNDGQDDDNQGWAGGNMGDASRSGRRAGGLGKALGGLILFGVVIAVLAAVFGGRGGGAPTGAASSAPATITITPAAPDPVASPAIPASAQDAVSSSPPLDTTRQTKPNSSGPKKAPADLDGLY